MDDTYTHARNRYDRMTYRRCGRSGLKLPEISLGCWHNFGDDADDDNCRRMIYDAFDLGITHFDLANNYGPSAGSAEQRVGKILKDLPRDELIISTKAGFPMWAGPYGDWGSRKHLLASLDQSLARLGLDYVDIFYHHRPDPQTPLEETMGALDHVVRRGKSLYVGISNYSGAQTHDAVRACRDGRLASLLIHQPRYSMLQREVEQDLFPVTEEHGLGVIAYCPLAQGLLTDKYLAGVPIDSRAASPSPFLTREQVGEGLVGKANQLNDLAKQRGQSLAQMALAWVLRDQPGRTGVTSALIGASRSQQIRDNVAALENLVFSDQELQIIDRVLGGD